MGINVKEISLTAAPMKWTEPAKRVMRLAHQEALQLNPYYVGTEHLLLGLVREGGMASDMLQHAGVDLATLNRAVQKIVEPWPDVAGEGKLPLAPRTKKVIEYAVEHARQLDRDAIEADDLFIGLLSIPEGVASQVLINLGFNLEELRRQVLGKAAKPRP
jgi:ATP-dependent Clp protease ATP-binding subunit ClpC